MADDTILCRKSKTTVADYKQMIQQGKKANVITFIRDRFTERYITPLEAVPKEQKNGFCIMAISCLMIEALESFRQGWPDTNGKSAHAFFSFFNGNGNFKIFRMDAQAFYKNIRCGILHQAETSGGWKITRLASKPLFDVGTKTINATKFHRELGHSLQQYCDALEKEDLSSDLWKNLIKKMKRVCENC